MSMSKAIESERGITRLRNGDLYIPPGRNIYIERYPFEERTEEMANVEGLHAVGKEVWKLIQGVRDGLDINDALGLSNLAMAIVAVKDDLDTKPELIPAALNIASGLEDAVAEHLRAAIPPPVA